MSALPPFNPSQLIADMVPGPFGLDQPVTTRQVFPEQGLSDGTSQSTTYRSRHVIQVAVPYLRLVYVNAGTPAMPTAAITYKAAADLVPAAVANVGGSLNAIGVTPVTLMGGQPSWTLQPGGTLISDPIFGPFHAGDAILVRTNVATATSGIRWPVGMALNWGYEGALGGDQTAAPNYSTAFTTAGPGVSPALILGPANGLPSVAVAGDSIVDGSGDSGAGPFNNVGPLNRALDPASIGYAKFGAPGERVASVVATGLYAARGVLAMQAKNIVCGYGTNDLANGDTLPTIQTNLITFWQMFSSTGRAVFQLTLDPRATSSDTWKTTTNQTLPAFEPVRTALNTWLRTGAPIIANIATPASAPGALVAGQPGHPLAGLFDTAGAVEVNAANILTPNGGYWIANGTANYATADGTHNTTAASILKAATIGVGRFRM